MAGAQFLVPVAVTGTVVAAVVAAHPTGARAATGSVLILSTSVTGGTSSAEATDVPAGYTVTVATPATWDAMTTAQFAGYSAIVIGDPSGANCAASVPSDALSTAATWGAAVTGNAVVVGTAPVFAGSQGNTLISDGLAAAVVGQGTGLYLSLNCEYATAAANTSVPLLAHVDGGGFTVTGQGTACPASGSVNNWAAEANPAFSGLADGQLGPWPSPACAVQETMNTWPAPLDGLAYDAAATPADFTASNGTTGQPYVLVGAPASNATQALAPAQHGEIQPAAALGTTDPASQGVSASEVSAGDGVDPQTGDYTQSDTDLNISGYGPPLSFGRTYDAQLAQQQTVAGTPGPMGYGWTDNWASSLSTGRPTPADIYTLDGTRANNGDGGPPAQSALSQPDRVYTFGSDTYIVDTTGNRVQEIPGTSKTQFGQAMTAGDIYTVAGSPSGVAGASGNGTPAAQTLLDTPDGVAMSAAGDLVISDSGNCRLVEIAATSGTQWGSIAMTAGDMYVIAGRTGQCTIGNDAKAATSSNLNDPEAISMFGGDVYVADAANNRIQMIASTTGTAEWNIASTTAGFVYTVAGSAAGTAGNSGDGGAAASALLDGPEGVKVSGNGVYLADTVNCQVREVAKYTGSKWGQSMTADDIYTVAGRSTGQCTIGNDNKIATSSNLLAPYGVEVGNGGQLYIADTGNNRVQEVAFTAHTEFGQAMTASFVYTVAGSPSGTGGFSGDGAAATSALLTGPVQAALDASGDLDVADTSNLRVRQVNAGTAQISTIAGDGFDLGDAGNGGHANTAGLSSPDGVGSDASGDVYIADTGNSRIHQGAAANHTHWGIPMTAGDVYTVAGSATGANGTSGNGGPATSALLNGPISVATDSAGDLFIADEANNRIQEVAARSGTQHGIAMTANDIYTVAGSAAGTSGSTGDGGPATSALLFFPWGLTVDAAGDIYLADQDNNRIQEIPAASGTHWGVSMTANDMYTVAGSATGTAGISGDGGLATAGLLTGPTGVAVDAAGNLYFTDSANNRIQEESAATGRQRAQSMTANHMYTIAGSATGSSGTSGDGGPATSALLFEPGALAADASSNLYVSDSFNNRIQEVAAANGTQWGTQMTTNDVYTIAGSATGSSGTSGDGGPATSALLDFAAGLAVDPAGNVYLTDNNNDSVREVTATSAGPFFESPTPGGITVTQPGAAQITFVPQSGGNCTAPYVTAGGYCALPQDDATLSYNSGSGIYTFSPGPGIGTLSYNQTGQLTSEADTDGDTLTLAYGTPVPGSGNCPAAAAQCTTVTATTGRTLVIGLSTGGLATSVTDPMGRRWLYGYTGNDLTSATDPMGNVTSYTYGAGSTGNPQLANDLLTITEPNAQPGAPDAGDATVNVYDASGRVTSQTDPMGDASTFSYCANAAAGNCLNNSTGSGDVTVTDANGGATVYNYSLGALTAETTWNGNTASEEDFGPATTAAGTTGGTLLDSWTTNADAAKTSFTYDAAGNEVSTTDPLGDTSTLWSTAQGAVACAASATAASACSSSQQGPVPVAPGGTITPPASAPPNGANYVLYDTDGNALYSSIGVYPPGSSTASAVQTEYTLYKGNSVTLNGTTITCTAVPPSAALPCASVDSSGAVTQMAYNAQGDLMSVTGPDGNGSQQATASYSYNADGQQTSEVSPDGSLPGATAANYTTATAYNADGLVTSSTSAAGTGATVTPRTVNYGYDGNGNQTSVADARGFTATVGYNADDAPTTVTDADGNSTLTCYDGAGNITQTVPPSGVAANGLTAASCPTSFPAGYSTRLAADATTYTFDATGQNTSTTTPAPAGQTGFETTTFSYDAAGQVTKETDPPDSNGGAALVTVDSYDANGNLAARTTGYGTPAAATTSYCYDPNGDQTAVVPPDGNAGGTTACETSSPWVISASAHPTQAAYQTTSSYDSAGQLVSATSPATAAAPSGATTRYTYDSAGNVHTSTDPNGVVTTSTYDATGNLATVSYSGSSAHSVSYSYDADGNVTGKTDATGSSSFVYDPFGDLTSATNGAGKTVSYGYNPDGLTTSITYPLPASATWAASDSVGYGYDHADQLTSVTDFNGHEVTIGNTPDGLPNSDTLGSTGDTIATSYDQTGNPTAITLKNASATLLGFGYSDAPSGDILAETDTPASAQAPSYTYDGQGRLASMTPGTGPAVNYGFDASGNLITTPTGATGSYDKAGELTSSVLAGTTTSYAYDADGQRLSSKQGATTITSGSWNGAGELTAYNGGAPAMTAASYDSDGMRASATTGGTTQNFTWDDSSNLLMDSTNAYIYAGGNAPIEQFDLASGAASYLATDTLGSVRGVVNGSTGNLTASTFYDPWGNPQTAGGLSSYTPFGYGGGYTDPTGLIYLINRYYDPATGQFLSVDPADNQTGQPYSYANGNPVNGTDPQGLWAIGIPSHQNPFTSEFQFRLWLSPLLGVPTKAQAEYQIRWAAPLNPPDHKDRRIDIYQKSFGWLNELKIGPQSWDNSSGSANGPEVRRDKYLLRSNSPFSGGVPTSIACHPHGKQCSQFQANGGTWWFRYKGGFACQMSFSGQQPCTSAKLFEKIGITDSNGPKMNVVWVFYTNRNRKNWSRVYKKARVQIRVALESNNCPYKELDKVGLFPTWKWATTAHPHECAPV